MGFVDSQYSPFAWFIRHAGQCAHMRFFLLLVNLTTRGVAVAAAEWLTVDGIKPFAYLFVYVLQIRRYERLIQCQLGNDPALDGVHRSLNSTFLLRCGRLAYPRFHAIVQAQRLNGRVSIALAPAVPINESQRVVHHKTLGDCPEVLKCINDACDPAGLFLIAERLGEHHVAVRQCGDKQLAMLNVAVAVDPWQEITGKVDFHALTGHSLNIAPTLTSPLSSLHWARRRQKDE